VIDQLLAGLGQLHFDQLFTGLSQVSSELARFSAEDWLVCLPLLLIGLYFWTPAPMDAPALLLAPMLAYVVYACWHFRQQEMGLMMVAGCGAVATAGALYVRRR
jgi:hypothetical protein